MILLLPCLILAAGLAASLFLFVSLKKELQLQDRKFRDFAQRLSEFEASGKTPVNAAPAPPRPGFNLNTRVQAMRLWRQGEPPDHIAALLGVPRNEVELLIRVRGMTAGATSSHPR